MRYILLRRTHLASLLLILFAGMSGAQVLNTGGATSPTNSISYQAQITGKDGKPISGQHTVTITLYSDAGGSQSIWSSTTIETIGDAGILNAALGSASNPLPTPVQLDRPLWVGVTVDGLQEMRPLTALSAVPIAINVADDAITSSKLAPNAVTADKMAADYVGSISVNGEKVTTKGGDLNIVTGDGIRSTYISSSNSLLLSGGSAGTDGKVQNANSPVYWSETGNNSTTPGTNFVGTSDGKDLVFKVEGLQTMLYKRHSTLVTPSIIGGDVANTESIMSFGSVIAGGGRNTTKSPNEGNTVWSPFGVIGGGCLNITGENEEDTFCTVAGGRDNWAHEEFSFIGGGERNRAESMYGMIGGGDSNRIEHDFDWSAAHSTIGGGYRNFIRDEYCLIGGGRNNIIYHDADYGTIGGGQDNLISNNNNDKDNPLDDLWWNTIGGGFDNVITGAGSQGSTIGGGLDNYIAGHEATVSGGNGNSAFASEATIAGGDANVISLGADFSFIGGGDGNQVDYKGSATAGGSMLWTSGEAQTVLGWGNLPMGNGHAITAGPNDDRIFEIGSPKKVGGIWVANNAFEVSYNGHSIVYHTNGSSIPGVGTPPVFQGATYVESPVYAWGQISAAGTAIGAANFGIQSISTAGCPPGVYIIELNPVDPHNPTGPPLDISEASVTVTVINNDVHDIVVNPVAPDAGVSSAATNPPGRVISDSLVQARFGASSLGSESESSSAEEPSSPNPKTPIDLTAVVCGYATASQFGVLGAGSEHKFVVRTYGAGSQDCHLEQRPFYFKVCHR